MAIEVNNLDQGYEQCNEMHSLSQTKGKDLVNHLSELIKHLEIDWKGSDATLHINNLIKVNDALNEILLEAISHSSDAASAMIALQIIRRKNGSGSSAVGQQLNKNFMSLPGFKMLSDTAEYNVAPGITSDYLDLVDFESKFKQFVNEFENIKSRLFSNWTGGADHTGALKAFNKFAENADVYEKYIEKAKDDLGKAIDNVNPAMD